MKNLLDALSDREVLTLAMEAFPEKIQEILDHDDVRDWLMNQEAMERILAKIPLRLLENAIGTASRSGVMTDNPLHLDGKTRTLLQGILAGMSKSLASRGRRYVDSISSLAWDEGIEGWRAQVRGTGLYQMAIHSDGGRACTCPYAYENGECKHQAALIMRLLRECANLGITDQVPKKSTDDGAPRVQSIAILKPSERTPSASPNTRKAHTDALSFLQRVSGLLQATTLDGENARQRVEFHLEVRKRSSTARVCHYDLVPHASSFRPSQGWETDLRDLRHGFDRFRTPPKYQSPHDVQTIALSKERMLSGGYGSNPLRCSHQLLEMATTTGRTLLGNGLTARMDPEYWKLVPQLAVEKEHGAFRFALTPLWGVTTDQDLADDWYILGEEGNWLVLHESVLYRLDPRTPQGLISLADETRRIPVSALEEARPVLHLLSKSGVDVPVGWLPPRLHEEPKGCAAVTLIEDCARVQVRFLYPSLEVDSSMEGDILAFTRNDGNLVELVRDRMAETRLVDELESLLHEAEVEFVADGEAVDIVGDHGLRRLAFAGLPRLETAGWTIRDGNRLDRWKTRKGKALLRGKSSGQDWFELSGVVDFEGLQIPLSSLVASKGGSSRFRVGQSLTESV